MALLGNGRRVARLEEELNQIRDLLPAEAFAGHTKSSPFITESGSILPWRRRNTEITESRATTVRVPARSGYLADIPWGGANEFNQGYTQIGGATDRRTLMQQLQMLYVTCPWSSACVDTIARTSTAGGMNIVPRDQSPERLEHVVLSAQVQKAQDLFDYINPSENFRQLMRGIFTDLLIYGDSFIEVVWSMGEPIALYSLPCPDMLIEADEHGVVSRYVQLTDTNRKAYFEPEQVIHIKFDSPRGGLYGLGPTEKAVHPITTWIYTEGLLKSTMKKGNPPNLGFGWPKASSENDKKGWLQKYLTRNIGSDNVGTPFEVAEGTQVHQLNQNKIAEYEAVKTGSRDEIFGEYGVPPAEATVIESGNIGGGTGTSQRKTFMINTCGPVQEIVLEAFTFAILQQGFGVEDHRCDFGEVDYRDDEIIEKIRTQRVERAGWSVNRYRDDIGEPPVDGGDDPVFILSRDVVPIKDIAAKSAAALVPKSPTGTVPEIGADGQPVPPQGGGSTEPADNKPPKHAKGSPVDESLGGLITEAEAHTGAMVALFLPTTVAGSLVVDGGEPAGEMHVTLAYLGDADELGDTDALAQVVAAWALETPPLASEISGLGLFNPNGGDNPPVTYASVDSPTLSSVRHRLVEALKRSGFPPNMEHGFTPHVTLAYDNVIDSVEITDAAFSFGAVTLAVAGERQSWPLTGTPVESDSSHEDLFESFEADLRTRAAEVMREMPKAGV